MIISNKQILLTLRQDFEMWCLPGGDVEPGESIEQAAIREVKEETGLDVRLISLVGIYSLPAWRNGGAHHVLFAARSIGGRLKYTTCETLDACYFSPDELPLYILPWQRQRIIDAMNNVTGIIRVQDVIWPFDQSLPLEKLYGIRDNSGLSRRQFFLRSFSISLPNVDV